MSENWFLGILERVIPLVEVGFTGSGKNGNTAGSWLLAAGSWLCSGKTSISFGTKTKKKYGAQGHKKTEKDGKSH